MNPAINTSRKEYYFDFEEKFKRLVKTSEKVKWLGLLAVLKTFKAWEKD